MINSRGDIHPDWVSMAIASVKRQYYPVKMIVVDNRELKHTIGACWNKAVREAKTEWVLFIGDDDWISRDYCYCLKSFAEDHPEYDCITTGMTFYKPDDTHNITTQQNTGMWKREYLLKYPFNEKLKKGIDREYVEEAQKCGCTAAHLFYHHGIFVRIHETHNLTKRPERKKISDIYFNARYPTFINPVVDRLRYQGYDVVVDNKDFNYDLAGGAKLIWADWCDENAYKLAEFKTKAKKIMRLHAYEAFTITPYYINWKAFDKVIFVADHIKEYVERILRRKITNSIVIPNGVRLDGYNFKNKKQNNKIAWAGNIDRKKGGQLLLFIAEHFPEYEFHVAGKFNEQDMIEYFDKRKPDNLFIHPYSYDLNKFFKDKTYFLNTSPREGCPVTPLEAMACGLKPLIYRWVGAEDYVSKYWTFKDMAELGAILNGNYDPWRYREYVENNYNFEVMYDSFKEIIDGAVTGKFKNKVQNSHKSRVGIGQSCG